MAPRLKRASAAVILFGVGAILSGCTNFDPESLTDMFNKKEKLPGDRRPLFPQGVPGVTQGVPPHLMVGQQQKEAEIAAAPPPAAEPEKPKAAAKPKPPRTASRPASVTVSPDQQPQQQQQQSGTAAPWPSPTAQQPPPSSSPSSSPWPSAPSSGTFQR